jgi:hypothetical protein
MAAPLPGDLKNAAKGLVNHAAVMKPPAPVVNPAAGPPTGT